jgi:hypothetical protein
MNPADQFPPTPAVPEPRSHATPPTPAIPSNPAPELPPNSAHLTAPHAWRSRPLSAPSLFWLSAGRRVRIRSQIGGGPQYAFSLLLQRADVIPSLIDRPTPRSLVPRSLRRLRTGGCGSATQRLLIGPVLPIDANLCTENMQETTRRPLHVSVGAQHSPSIIPI